VLATLNSTQDGMFPSTSGMYHPLPENRTVHAVKNVAVPDPMMDNSARVDHGMN